MPSYFKYFAFILVTVLFVACKKSDPSGNEALSTSPPTTLDFIVTGNFVTGSTLVFTAVNADDMNISWNFGSGSTAKGRTVSFTYNYPGNYTVKMLPDNNTNTVSKTIVITYPKASDRDMARLTTARTWYKTLSLSNSAGTTIIGYDSAVYALTRNKDTLIIPGETKFTNFASPQRLRQTSYNTSANSYSFYSYSQIPQVMLSHYLSGDSIVYTSSFSVSTPASSTYKLTCVAK